MNAMRWTTTTTTMLLVLCATPAAAQTPGSMGHGAMPHGGQQGMMAPCWNGGAIGPGRMGQGMGTGRMGAMHGQGTAGAGTMGAGAMMGFGPAGMMGWMGPIGLEGAGTDPVALLGAADALELSPAQRDRLDAIAGTERQDREEQMGVASDAYRRAADALQAGPADLKAYEQALQEAANAVVQARVATARARSEAGEVLTPEQRTKLRDSVALVGSMVCGEVGAANDPDTGPGGER
jgi:Spy/CpxP family protein refolding chaperone